MAKVAIVGGGISGVAAAYYLAKAARTRCSSILLLEASSHIGGWVQSTRFDDGAVYEHGPRSLRGVGDSGANTLLLAEELGLSDEIVPVKRSHPAGSNRFIYANNEICPLPSGPGGLFRKLPPFSKPLASYGWKEPFRKAPKLEDDTVFNFFSRRFGEEIAKYAVDPLCRGVYAGDAKKLSIRACMPQLFKYEQEYGSVLKGALKAPRNRQKIDSPLYERYKTEKWALWSFKNGLQHLPETMIKSISDDDRVNILTSTPCEGIEFCGDHVKVKYGGKIVEVDHVIGSAPASNISTLLPVDHSFLSDRLSSIPSVTCGVVSLEFEDVQLPHQGFGHLVPSCEPSKVLGVLYESCTFPGHDNKSKNTTKLTCMMGGAWFEELFGDPDACQPDALIQVAADAIREQLKISKEPYRALCRLQKDCIPQYLIGHAQNVEAMNAYVEDNSLPLSLVGASYLGPSVNDCIYHTKTAVEKVIGQTS